MKHKVLFTIKSAKEIVDLGKEVTDKLYDNFITPIDNGLTPPEELQGKYKPSWAARFIDSPMRKAFVKNAKQYNLHHYHFGYRIYTDGRDPQYPGDVSDGIVHTRIDVGEGLTKHVIVQACLDHPSPFKYPFERSSDNPLDDKAA